MPTMTEAEHGLRVTVQVQRGLDVAWVSEESKPLVARVVYLDRVGSTYVLFVGDIEGVEGYAERQVEAFRNDLLSSEKILKVERV